MRMIILYLFSERCGPVISCLLISTKVLKVIQSNCVCVCAGISGGECLFRLPT